MWISTVPDRQRLRPQGLLCNNADPRQLWSWFLMLLQAVHLLRDHSSINHVGLRLNINGGGLFYQHLQRWHRRGCRCGVHWSSRLTVKYLVPCHLTLCGLFFIQVTGHGQAHLWGQVVQRPQTLLKRKRAKNVISLFKKLATKFSSKYCLYCLDMKKDLCRKSKHYGNQTRR